MAEERVRERERADMGYGGASIAFIAVYGAINGALALVPIFPYFGGGGFIPLSVMFTAIGPLVLGPIGGILAAVIGGVIGMFVSPGMFPLGLLDVMLTGILPALFVALTINTDETLDWILTLVAIIITGVMFIVFPYVWPGIPGQTPTVAFWFTTLPFWVPWLIVMLTPLKNWIPEWARGEDPKKRIIGIFLGIFIGIELFYYWWAAPYWLIFSFPLEVSYVANLGYLWWWPIMSIITTVIAVPVIEALKRSGLPRIPRALW